MKQDIRDVMLANMQANKTGRLEQEHRLIGVPVKNAYYGEGQVVGLMHGGSLVLMEFDGGPITVIKDLEYVLDEDSTVELSIEVLEKRFGHLREIKKAAKRNDLGLDNSTSKNGTKRVLVGKQDSTTELKPKLKSIQRSSSITTSDEKPKMTASRRRVQEVARLGPPPGAKTLFGDRASK